MRSRLAALLLFAVLSVMSLLIGPAPSPAILDNGSPPKWMDPVAEPDLEPYGILDIGPPPKGKTAEQYLYRQIAGQTGATALSMAWCDPAVRKLPSVTAMADARHWLAQYLQVTAEEGERRLRFTFEAGTRAEQVTIINAFLRATLSTHKSTLKWSEECLCWLENRILLLEGFIESGRDPDSVDDMRMAIIKGRFVLIPERRTAIARAKQYAVIRWAR